MRPYCLVLPQTSEEVSTALTALINANNGAGDWHIALKSGGHGVSGSNNIANGVTIDLSHMNASSYDPQSNTAKIQPGGRWKNVYADLDKQGVTVTGGRDGDVGVGGFLLGGGNSFFSGRMGFGCDSVVNFEVVLANGTIVNANTTTNADLWQALKGGSSNFGIVTQFDMEAIPARDLAYDLRFLSSNYSDTVVDAVVEFTNQNQSLADNHLITYYAFNASRSSEIYIGCINVNTQGDLNAATAFNKVKALPALSNAMALQSMAEAAEGSQLPSGISGASSTLFFRNDPQILRSCVEIHANFVEALKRSIDPAMFTTMLFFQPIPTYIGQIGKQRGGNMLGLDAIRSNAILWTAGAAVDPAAGEAAFAVAQAETYAMTAKTEAMLRSLNGDLGFRYLNYADASQDPLGSYGAANIQHIRNVAAQYDPTGVFQNRIPGGFKISRVA
ncbi:FAD binding domain-containing protein [Hypoxylon rubiginosum]|uniref:FAD binding domain-containing protein n=1 Tax=Hypoxylon rubiginosum TaxID=110542 RepID=A0ACB9Z1X5_9PEZI|nr:FAD binding domain-containing protein [Hypoxylon rubiginosum]